MWRWGASGRRLNIHFFGLLQAGTEWLGGDCEIRYRCSGGEPLGDVLIFTFWFVTGRY